jgi:hypothetical protein
MRRDDWWEYGAVGLSRAQPPGQRRWQACDEIANPNIAACPASTSWYYYNKYQMKQSLSSADDLQPHR